MARKCSNWLATYEEHTKDSEAPRIFHLWSALTVVSAVLRRQVYRNRRHFDTWPNLYTFLVGPPGTKKSSAINIGGDLLKQVQDPPHIISSFHTAPFLISSLKGVVSQHNPGKAPFIILADEAASFFRRAKYAEDIIPILIQCWDCKTAPGGGTQLRGLEEVVDPYGCGLFGAVPEILVDIMPQELLKGGLSSRIIWVYSDDTTRCIPRPETLPPPNPQVQADLMFDLNEMSTLRGEMDMTNECGLEYDTWYHKHKIEVMPKIDNPKRVGYMNRKTELVYKVMMLLSITESNSMLIETKHYRLAKVFLKELEPYLDRVYQATVRGSSEIMAVEMIERYVEREGGAVSETDLSNYCWNNGISMKDQFDACASLCQRGILKEDYNRGKIKWFVKI